MPPVQIIESAAYNIREVMAVIKRLISFVTKADLPGEVLCGLPQIAMTGFSLLQLDCHKGLLQYTENEICVQLTIGRVRILGTELQLSRMHRDGLSVTGNISSLEFSEDGK